MAKRPGKAKGRARGAASEDPANGRLGVWLVGVNGGLATTLIAGARMIVRGLSSRAGLITETPAFSGLDVCGIDDLVFGGHDIRPTTVYQSALEIYRDNGTIPHEKIEAIRGDLDAVDADTRVGSAVNCGDTIRSLASPEVRDDARPLREDGMKRHPDPANQVAARVVVAGTGNL